MNAQKKPSIDELKFPLQLFLSLMDTIHDFGNVARVTKVFSGKEIDEANESNETNANTNNYGFNAAYLLDFLMLSSVQNYFRKMIGLEEHQHYVAKIKDCSTKEFVDKHSISRNICMRFYFSTYAKKMIFRSPQPENITRDVLYSYVKEVYNIDYDTVVSTEFDNITYNENYVYTIKLGNTKKLTGIFSLNTIAQANKLSEIVKNICGFNSTSQIAYVTDANQLNNDLFSSSNNMHYQGLFTDYDAVKTKKIVKTSIPTVSKNNEPSVFRRNSDNSQSGGAFINDEFTIYSLTKSANELLFFDELGVFQQDSTFIIGHYINKIFRKIELDARKIDKTPNGLSLFLKIINEINKKTLGALQIRNDQKLQLISKLKQASLQALEDRYRITIGLEDKSRDYAKENIAQLERQDFILALFDLKRSMDYLYVKAAKQAQRNNTKFVFVSNDRSAIFYALWLDIPCILTTPAKRNGDQEITVFRPRNISIQNSNLADIQISRDELNKLELTIKKITTLDEIYEKENLVENIGISLTKQHEDLEIEFNRYKLSNDKLNKKIARETDARKKEKWQKDAKKQESLLSNIEAKMKYIDDKLDKIENIKDSIVMKTRSLKVAPTIDPTIVNSIDSQISNNRIKYTNVKSNIQKINANVPKLQANIKSNTNNYSDIQEYVNKKISNKIAVEFIEQIKSPYVVRKTNYYVLPYGKTDKPDLRLYLTNAEHRSKIIKIVQYLFEKFTDINSTLDFREIYDSYIKPFDLNSQIGAGNKNANFFNNNFTNDRIPAFRDVNKSKRIPDKILDEEIPLTASLLSSFDNDPEFQKFLSLYSTLSNSMTYFWYITYRSIFYFIDKTGNTRIIDDFYDAKVQGAQNVRPKQNMYKNK